LGGSYAKRRDPKTQEYQAHIEQLKRIQKKPTVHVAHWFALCDGFDESVKAKPFCWIRNPLTYSFHRWSPAALFPGRQLSFVQEP
jgi:hypothetical protein